MRKIIAAINMTLDGFSDHTAIDPDEEIHRHYTQLLNDSGVTLYGRITYELMGFWQTLVANPGSEKDMNDFAVAIDRIPKIVFSTTLKSPSWNTARLAHKSLEDELSLLKQEDGKNILMGSRSLIIQALKLNLLDELQLCIHPVIAGSGLPLFENLHERKLLKLIKTKTFGSGAQVFYYEPVKNP